MLSSLVRGGAAWPGFGYSLSNGYEITLFRVWARLFFILSSLFDRQFARLVLQHDRDVVADGVGQLTGTADEFGFFRPMDQGPLADWAGDDIEEFLVQGVFLAVFG